MILAIIWDKIILRFIKKPDYTKSSEEFLQNLKKLANNDEIVIRDDSIHKLYIAMNLLYVIVFTIAIFWNLEPVVGNFWKETARKGALMIAILAVISSVYFIIKALIDSKKHTPLIKISKDYISYNIMDINLLIDLNKIIKITYGYMPCNYEAEKIDTRLLSDDRYGRYFFIPLGLFIALLQYTVFYIVSIFKIQKHVIIETDEYIFSIPLENELLKISKNLKFNIRTIMKIY